MGLCSLQPGIAKQYGQPLFTLFGRSPEIFIWSSVNNCVEVIAGYKSYLILYQQWINVDANCTVLTLMSSATKTILLLWTLSGRDLINYNCHSKKLWYCKNITHRILLKNPESWKRGPPVFAFVKVCFYQVVQEIELLQLIVSPQSTPEYLWGLFTSVMSLGSGSECSLYLYTTTTLMIFESQICMNTIKVKYVWIPYIPSM